MIDSLASLAGVAGALALFLLPGAWISFGLPLQGARPWVRLCTGGVLSPFVLYVQYYLLRWVGLSFDASVPVLVVGNLLVLPLVVRALRPAGLPDPGDVLASIVLLTVPLACVLVPVFLQPIEFPWWLHSWVHTGTIYELANGSLIPEEVRLAGIDQAYPWAAHLTQALLSRVLDRAPPLAYIGTNLMLLLLTTFLVGEFVRELGGGRRARAVTWVTLWFGINAFGFAVRHWVMPERWEFTVLGEGSHETLFGDVRYTPWLWKYRFHEHIVFGMAMFAALPHFVLRIWRGGPRVLPDLLMIAALLCGIIVVYPVLAAAAFGTVAGCAVLMAVIRRWEEEQVPFERAIQLGVVLLVCGLLGVAHFKLLTSSRHYGTGGLVGAMEMLRKSIESLIVTAPLLVAVALRMKARWRVRPRAEAILIVGTIVSLALSIGLRLPPAQEEHKYVFATGICLAPIGAIVLDPLFARLRGAWFAALFVACLVLAIPFAIKADKMWGWPEGLKPPVQVADFDLRFAPSVEGAAAYDAIRDDTPIDTGAPGGRLRVRPARPGAARAVRAGGPRRERARRRDEDRVPDGRVARLQLCALQRPHGDAQEALPRERPGTLRGPGHDPRAGTADRRARRRRRARPPGAAWVARALGPGPSAAPGRAAVRLAARRLGAPALRDVTRPARSASAGPRRRCARSGAAPRG